MLPRALQIIGERAFADCKYLKLVVFGDNSELREIGPNAFYGSGLESFSAPLSLKQINDAAFSCCSMLRDLQLNEGLETLDKNCFAKT